jgi:DNA-binding NarL/FixJ family response regulator
MIGWMRGTVLIVDDNARFRVRARRTLEADGHVVVGEAADGASALEAVRRHRPDVALVDVGLPDVSGLAVSERLAREPDAPAVVLTSTHDVADFGGDRLARCGARGFVPKAALTGAALAAVLSRPYTVAPAPVANEPLDVSELPRAI